MYILENDNLDMRKIANSGQIFRFNEAAEGKFELIAADKILFIEELEVNDKKKYALSCDEKEFDEYWKEYFDLNTDYKEFEKNVPKEDDFLNKAIEYSKGIRILKQDKWEMLISFIISQRKSIPAIKSSIEKLAAKFGKEISEGKFAFPTPYELAKADLSQLESCSLGYRAPYIYETAKKVASGEYNLEELGKLSDEELLKALMELKGVGIKVANCVALFGYYRIASFPIDVWIQRMIDTHYSGNFPLEKYDGHAGIIQQYIFYYGRESK